MSETPPSGSVDDDDQDAGPTMTAPAGIRPDGIPAPPDDDEQRDGVPLADSHISGLAEDPDVADTDVADTDVADTDRP